MKIKDMSDQKPYILGTEQAELHRLGVQHEVWASEAKEGWKIAGFGFDQTILDLGCGPGFCSTELGYSVGANGKVKAVDRSENYINFLKKLNELHGLNIEAICSDFNDLELKENSLDGVYIRWALAWIPNPEEILEKLYHAMRPGSAIVIQEYFDWSTFQTQPEHPGLKKAIDACYKSFKEQAGDIDVGKRVPGLLSDCDLEVISIRPMCKMATPEDLTWQWPQTFLEIYAPKLVETGYLTDDELQDAMDGLHELADYPSSIILCPQMIEVVAVKV